MAAADKKFINHISSQHLMKKHGLNRLIIAAFVAPLPLPFSNKAYHMDDPAFLAIADQIAKDPLRPYSFSLEWGQSAKSAAQLLDTPLVPYYIAFVTWLFGRSEMILHLAFLIFPLMAGASFYFIAGRFVPYPLVAALLLISSPVFLPNSHNLMLDIPSLSFFLLSMALFVNGVDRKSHALLSLGSIAAGLAFLAKPQSLVIIPLLAFYCIVRKKRTYLIYQLIPVFFVILFSTHNYFFEGSVIAADYISFLSGAKQSSVMLFAAYALSNLSSIGGAVLFPLLLFSLCMVFRDIGRKLGNLRWGCAAPCLLSPRDDIVLSRIAQILCPTVEDSDANIFGHWRCFYIVAWLPDFRCRLPICRGI